MWKRAHAAWLRMASFDVAVVSDTTGSFRHASWQHLGEVPAESGMGPHASAITRHALPWGPRPGWAYLRRSQKMLTFVSNKRASISGLH